MKETKIIRLITTITILLIGIDQISKILIQMNYDVPIGNDIIGITLMENTGMAFGLNEGNFKNILLTSLVLGLMVHFIRNQKDKIDRKTAVAISFILSGGISNLLDRIIRGGVVDFIDLKKFAIFNIADCCVVIGWVLLVVFLIQYNKEIVRERDCEKP